MDGPETAFLILAHSDAAHLLRLTQALRAPWARCFVHISGKTPRKPFDDALAACPDCFVLPDEERVTIAWGGYSIFEAVKRLVLRAETEMPGVRRFCVLSGADYPVQPMSVLARSMASDVEYIKIDRAIEWAGSHKHDKNVTHPYFGSILPMANPRSGSWFVAKVAERLSRILRNPAPPGGVAIFHGSFWCSLTRESMDWVVERLDAQPRLRRWFKRIKIPDEFIIHTLLKASPFAGRISQDLAANPTAQGPENLWGSHYVNWESGNPDLPRTLIEGDFDDMRKSGALFARKMDPVRSKTLLALIDDVRREEPRLSVAP